jgi:hypothetical protein
LDLNDENWPATTDYGSHTIHWFKTEAEVKAFMRKLRADDLRLRAADLRTARRRRTRTKRGKRARVTRPR